MPVAVVAAGGSREARVADPAARAPAEQTAAAEWRRVQRRRRSCERSLPPERADEAEMPNGIDFRPQRRNVEERRRKAGRDSREPRDGRRGRARGVPLRGAHLGARGRRLGSAAVRVRPSVWRSADPEARRRAQRVTPSTSSSGLVRHRARDGRGRTRQRDHAGEPVGRHFRELGQRRPCRVDVSS